MTEELNNNLKKLIKGLEKQNSFKRSFLMSVIQGVGGVIGATIVAGMLLFVLSKFIHSVEQVPLIGNLVKSINIVSSINTKTSPLP
jgi:uncharacterized protein (DUF697 family)